MKTKKRFFENFIIRFVFIASLLVLVGVSAGVVYKTANVEKDNPVLVAEDFSYAILDGRYYRAVDRVPETLRLVSFDYFKGARREGVSAFNQAFRERFTYAVYEDTDGSRFVWVRDADFYAADYEWADPQKDFLYFDQFSKSYFYKEME
jgi:hypothetical protein